MLGSYLKVALAVMQKYKLYAFINIAGLAVGLAACIIIGLYVRHELSYDTYHPDADRIYRVTRDHYSRNGSPELFLATNAFQAAPLLQEDFPEIESATRILRSSNLLVRNGEIANYEDELRFAESNLFEFFAFDWLQGNPASALAEPGALVLTQNMAARYFSNKNAMGQVLELPSGRSLRVTGVIGNLPDNTHLSADGFASLATLINQPGPQAMENWSSNNFYTYIKLREGTSPEAVETGIPAFMNRHMGSGANEFSGMTIMPLTDIQLHSAFLQFPMKPVGSINTVVTLAAVAICILLIACFNFMNLSITGSTQRGKEIGLRKAIGANRREIIIQFLGESLVSSLVALALALTLVEMFLPVFNAFLNTHLELKVFSDVWLLLSLIAGSVSVGVIAGAYPAFHVAAFRSARVLRGDVTRGRAGQLFRNTLVILQFSVSIVLLVATAVVFLQLNYARTLDMGFKKEHVIILDNLDARWETLRNLLLDNPDIISVSASNIAPGKDNANGMVARYEGGSEDGRAMQILMVDYDFFDTYQIAFLAGRDFSEDFGTDRLALPTSDTPKTTGAYILSEMAVRQFGWTPETALASWFELNMGNGFERSARGPVIGVVRDINFESVATPIEPIVYFLPPDNFGGVAPLATASVRLSGNRLRETLAFIDATWADVYPDRPLSRAFVDQTFQALYLNEERLGLLFTSFAALAIVIACLGLFGLASFNAERRTKEIGVRKVMGGSVWSIVMLLTNDFSKLVWAANVIAWPVAYVAMERWLESFAYRIDLTPLVFIGSGLIALCIAWVTVGGTAAKAASAKPVLALRYE